MATITVNGQRVSVDDSFLDLPHEQKVAKVDEIAASLRNGATNGGGSQDKSYRGSVLPFSRDAQGNVHFDLGAGIPGAIWNAAKGAWDAATLPGDVASGRAIVPSSDNNESMARTVGLAALALPANPATKAGEVSPVDALAGARRAKVVPTASELKTTAGAQYDRVFGNPDKNMAGMGVDYTPKSLQELANTTDRYLFAKGIHPTRAPETYGVIEEFSNPPPGSVVTLANLHAARKTLGDVALKSDGEEKIAATSFLKRLDGFLERPPAEGVLAGPAAAAGEELARARRNTAASKRSNTITGELDNAVTGIGERAELGAQTANSGQNIDNAIRQRTKSLLFNKDKLAGFNKEEIQALKGVSEGSAPRNALRILGNLGGGGLGLGTTFLGSGVGGYGVASGSPGMMAVGFGLPAAGIGARQASNVLTRKALEKADELVRKRSPLYEEGGAGWYVPGTAERAALIKALMESRIGAAIPPESLP